MDNSNGTRSISVHNGNGRNDVADFVGRQWDTAWKEHLGWLKEDVTASRPDSINPTLDFLRESQIHHGATVFYAQYETTIVGSIVCQQWRGPVPIDVIDRDVLSLGTVWGFGTVASLDAEMAGTIRHMLLQRAICYLRDRLQCHKVLVLSFSEAETQAYRDAGFES